MRCFVFEQKFICNLLEQNMVIHNFGNNKQNHIYLIDKETNQINHFSFHESYYIPINTSGVDLNPIL